MIPTAILLTYPSGEFNHQSTYWSFLCFRTRLTLKHIDNKLFFSEANAGKLSCNKSVIILTKVEN